MFCNAYEVPDIGSVEGKGVVVHGDGAVGLDGEAKAHGLFRGEVALEIETLSKVIAAIDGKEGELYVVGEDLVGLTGVGDGVASME